MSGASAGTSSINQETLTAEMKWELAGATWTSLDILENLLPHDSDTVNEVCNRLEEQGLSQATFKNEGPWNMTRPEKEYYHPFTRILNFAFEAARTQVKKPGYYNLRFSHYDRQVKDGIDNAPPLKPDIVACNRDIPKS
jgi:hypothetical protein